MRNPLFYYFCNENMKRTTKLGIAGCVAAAVAALVFFARPIYKALSPKPVEEGDLTEFPVRGIDISSHNGSVDFDRAAALGIRFVIMKASEGSDFKDAAFIDNIRRAREAGLKVGVYHFFRFDADGRMQALNLLHSVRGRRLDMPLVIDLEEWGNPQVATSAVVSRLETMLAALDDAGMSVMLYTNKDGYYRMDFLAIQPPRAHRRPSALHRHEYIPGRHHGVERMGGVAPAADAIKTGRNTFSFRAYPLRQ